MVVYGKQKVLNTLCGSFKFPPEVTFTTTVDKAVMRTKNISCSDAEVHGDEKIGSLVENCQT